MDVQAEMDLTTHSRDAVQAEACKMRVAKSVFSIRSLVDLGEVAEKLDGSMEDKQILNEGKKNLNSLPAIYSTKVWVVS